MCLASSHGNLLLSKITLPTGPPKKEHGIEKAYVEKLESVPTQMDPNPERESQERR